MSALPQTRSVPGPADLTAFYQRYRRLPPLGDAVAPWCYRGWLLPYVIRIHGQCSAVADRWGYHLRTLEAGHLLDEPIPQITFGPSDAKVFSLLQEWVRLISRDCGGWSDFRTLLDWLSWGLALSHEAPRLNDDVNEKLYRQGNLGPLLERPYDYLGEFVYPQGKRLEPDRVLPDAAQCGRVHGPNDDARCPPRWPRSAHFECVRPLRGIGADAPARQQLLAVPLRPGN